MAYIDFGNTPVKETNNKTFESCSNCPHKINITKDIARCDVNNSFMFNKQLFDKTCEHKIDTVGKRKCIFGVFTYTETGDIVWTGIAGGAVINNSNDKTAIDGLYNNFKETILKNFPDFKNIHIVYCLIAEAINDSNYIPKTNFIPKAIINDIVSKMNHEQS